MPGWPVRISNPPLPPEPFAGRVGLPDNNPPAPRSLVLTVLHASYVDKTASNPLWLKRALPRSPHAQSRQAENIHSRREKFPARKPERTGHLKFSSIFRQLKGFTRKSSLLLRRPVFPPICTQSVMSGLVKSAHTQGKKSDKSV